MSETVDARGLACPAPVMMAKKAVDDGNLESITILVDNEASMENVSRFFASRLLGVDVIREGSDFKITAEASEDTGTDAHGIANHKDAASAYADSQTQTQTKAEAEDQAKDQAEGQAQTTSAALETRASSGVIGVHKQKIMVFAATDRIGFGDDELGKKLMISFLKTIREMGDELWRLVFVNNGVKLTIEASEVLEDLQTYEAEGLKILVCGTCLTHFNLMDVKMVGETTNMLDIVTAMQLADKVIKL